MSAVGVAQHRTHRHVSVLNIPTHGCWSVPAPDHWCGDVTVKPKAIFVHVVKPNSCVCCWYNNIDSCCFSIHYCLFPHKFEMDCSLFNPIVPPSLSSSGLTSVSVSPISPWCVGPSPQSVSLSPPRAQMPAFTPLLQWNDHVGLSGMAPGILLFIFLHCGGHHPDPP